ncbi:MAG TPA: mRNA surveillance protein pelota [Candidatus Syntrophoarchaeum butanivorans]|uniref:Protein pelota homolog n=1 Tax=Candidatus Syntropharchaeum butanivorans TaxID=1839936 RepID=A0A1F2P4H0_9EURY|nr:MAG: mRNA surveillance protein Pelota [Candidatus Syntrophoarchaeum butanivorans]HEC56680.1 mRNA surveillance protein pelota [Candidatus Syntrophoarchaeum butanivorans]
MKILEERLKRGEGEIKLLAESLDDLWHLKYIVEPGDLVHALTYRRMEEISDKIRSEKREKKPVYLGVRVEGVELHRFSNRLRIHGVIEEGGESGSYHTLNIEPGDNLKITKLWRKDQLERIKEAVESSSRSNILILTIEEGYASCGKLCEFGVEELFTCTGSRRKRRDDSRGKDFFDEVMGHLRQIPAEFDLLVVAGPGFVKDEFVARLRAQDQELSSKLTVLDTQSVGPSGYQEVLRKGKSGVLEIASSFRVAEEAELIEEFLREVALEGKAAYGFDEVRSKAEIGAVKTLLILDEILRESRIEGGEDLDDLIKLVENTGGRVVIFSSEFEPGKRLKGLGGIGAVLRY